MPHETHHAVNRYTISDFFSSLLKIPHGLRFKVREFYSGQLEFGQKVVGRLQNNVTFTGGLLIQF